MSEKKKNSQKITICFDGRILRNGLNEGSGRTGIYWTSKNILEEMVKRENFNISLFLNKDDVKKKNKILAQLDVSDLTIIQEDDDLSDINCFFSPVFEIPDFIYKYPNISCYTILYDITPLLFPKYFIGAKPSSWFTNLFNSLNNQDFYFSISDYTKKDFLKFCPKLQEKQITTTLLSTNFKYAPNKGVKKLKQAKEKYNIPADKKYLFSLCSLEPRKNLIRAVKTFIQFIEKNKIDDLVFVLGGGEWAGFIEKLEKEVPDYQKYQDKIIRAGYVADEDLEVLYSNAEWFVYTSQYEGFGMPPLEAMSCGTAVITSNNSSLPEVVGDAGQMIDWDSDEQHIEAYEKYYFDKKYRDKMAKKGLERSKQFSWKNCVDIMLAKMQEVEKKKSQKPLVTIITASYNLIDGGRKEWFIQNMESVQNQTYKNVEHIVIDGASKDGTIELLKEYQQKGWIKYYSEPDKGIYDAMNKGILKAKGKYVVCLNSDDFYCNNRAIEMLVQKAEELDADACCGSAYSINPQNIHIKNFWSCDKTDYLIFGDMACHQTFLIKTDVMKELGLYDLKYKVSADTGFMYKMLNKNKKISKIDEIIITYRIGGFSNNADAVKKDVINSLFENYGQYHQLTRLDCANLVQNNFLSLPLDEAIKLGSKLGKPEWIEQYFTILAQQRGFNFGSEISKGKIKYKLFNFIPLMKIKKDVNKMKVKLFGFLPIFSYKQKGGRTQYNVLGLPFFKIRRMENGITTKYYILGIPVMKVSRKECR